MKGLLIMGEIELFQFKLAITTNCICQNHVGEKKKIDYYVFNIKYYLCISFLSRVRQFQVGYSSLFLSQWLIS